MMNMTPSFIGFSCANARLRNNIELKNNAPIPIITLFFDIIASFPPHPGKGF
jgi:hypothetical protein